MANIIFSSIDYYPLISGASLYVKDLAESFVQKGHDVYVYTLGDKTDYFVRNGVHVRSFKSLNTARGYGISYDFLKSILKENPGIIHSHHYGYFPASAGFLAAKIKKIPHVISPHYHPPVYGFGRLALFGAYHITQGLPILKFSEKIAPHTNFEKKLLCKIGASEENVEILPCIVDVEQFVHKKEKKQARLKENVVLYVAPLLDNKGYHILLKIAEKILAERNDTTFVFIGHSYPNVEREFARKISKYKNKIIWLKDIKLKELIYWYNIADVFVLPSMYEAFGRVMAEAQACEVPVVATKVGAIPEVVQNKKTGLLVDYGDWEEMKISITKLLDDKKLMRRMGVAGRKNVVKKFSKCAVISKLDHIYNSLM